MSQPIVSLRSTPSGDVREGWQCVQMRSGELLLPLAPIGLLHAVERQAREREPSAEDTQALRAERAALVLARLDDLMGELGQRALPQSPLSKAVGYYTSQRDTLGVYLREGRLGIDNNPVENQIRAVAVGRTNWLFAGSPASGERAAAMYTLIGSAKLAGVDPLAYLTDVIGHLATTEVSRVSELTPLRWKAARANDA